MFPTFPLGILGGKLFVFSKQDAKGLFQPWDSPRTPYHGAPVKKAVFLWLAPAVLLAAIVPETSREEGVRELLKSVTARPARVVRVLEGGRFEAEVGDHREEVVLAGIVCPPILKGLRAERMAREQGLDIPQLIFKGTLSRRFLEGLLPPGCAVHLEADERERDEFGRLRAYVYAGNAMANESMLLEGYAVMERPAPPVRHRERFEKAEAQARAARAGLHSLKP